MLPMGNTTLVLAYEHIKESTSTPYVATAQGAYSDHDKTAYDVAAIQKFQGGEAGVLVQYLVDKSTRTNDTALLDTGYQTKAYIIDPYMKATFGPVFVEGELYYGGGFLQKYDVEQTRRNLPDVKVETYGAYLHGKGTFGPAYAGAKFLMMKGDDPNTLDKKEGGLAAALTMGQVTSPCLILWNDPTMTWMGALGGAYSGGINNFMDNLWFYGVYGGIKPIPKLDVQLAWYYAYADEKPTANGRPESATNPKYVSDKYGHEVDLTVTYSIYDNLQYMIGAGYLFTGDYFKGTNSANKVENDYMITHKLTLSF